MRRIAKPIDPALVTRTTPLRLDVAAKLYFPDGTITASTLRLERDRGTLVVRTLGGKDYTSLADIESMMELCRRTPKAHVSGPSHRTRVRTEAAGPASGSSETDPSSAAQASLSRTAERLRRELKKPSRKDRAGQP